MMLKSYLIGLGRHVMVLLSGEAYASEVIVDIGCVMPIPEHLSMSSLAAIPEAFITAYDALWIQAVAIWTSRSVFTLSGLVLVMLLVSFALRMDMKYMEQHEVQRK